MGAVQTIKELKDAGQDFEWYPTTREIIEAMYWDLLGDKVGEEMHRANGKRYTMLDIGAGNGKVFNTIKEIAESQPLLDEYYYCKYSREDGGKSYRSENERFANRIFISKYMAIEKSRILVDSMPKDTLVVGNDFHQNTLIDKPVDVVFCNPPYSEYAEWTTKIIRESNAKSIYLVIPQRWGKHKGIAQALKDRKAKVKIIGNFDFLNAEDRKARAYVSLIKVQLNYYKFKGNRYSCRESEISIDPFDLWFKQTFKINASTDREDYASMTGKADNKEKKFKNKVDNELVAGRDLVSILVQLYDQEMEKLIGNYIKLSEIDAELFTELNVNFDAIKESFKSKIEGLKNFYWEEIFNNLSEITKRLTSSTRDKLRSKLMANTSIDFNESNIRSVVIWVLKNANHYFEEQMLDFYDTFTTEEGIKFYKSNQHFVKDDFRYNKREGKLNKYALDYRIILHSYLDDWDIREGRVSNAQYQNIRDALVIARNLGFSISEESNFSFATADKYNGRLSFGEKTNIFFASSDDSVLPKGTKTLRGKIDEVYCHTNIPNKNGKRVMVEDEISYVYSVDNKSIWYQYKIGDYYHDYKSVKTDKDIFTSVRPYKNGNIHFQFNKKFIQKLNLEVGRLRGWIKSPQEAAQEFDITVEEAQEGWNGNFTLLPENLQNLLPSFKAEENVEPIADPKEKTANNVSYTQEDLEVFSTGLLF